MPLSYMCRENPELANADWTTGGKTSSKFAVVVVFYLRYEEVWWEERELATTACLDKSYVSCCEDVNGENI
jgi:hypothetical protein